jgi:hypothetical protein
LIGPGLIVLLAAGIAASDPPAPLRFAQIVVRERLIVRVPTRPARPRAATRWRERSAPRCMPLNGLAGAAVTERDSVDLIFSGNIRVRAQLDSGCSGLDYYSGFYLRPTEDGRICAGRDSIHARSGGECEIKRFRSLVPAD